MEMVRDTSDPRIGQVIDGRYRIRECIGAGGMGLVYRAERERVGRSVAVKFLHAEAASDPRFLRRFEVEARALAKLQHPHIVTVMDFGVADVPYIVMHYVDGPTLRDVLERGRVPAQRAIGIAHQLLGGLAHAHERGIVHRDIKPENVKLEEVTGTQNHVRLLDFGLAKLRSAVTWTPPSNPFITVGTPSYMSPEQFAGAAIDARSDVYSTGAMLFELVTGRKPFEFNEPREGFEMHTDWPRPRLRHIAPDAGLSAQLEQIVLRAMAVSPDERFQTAMEFSAALDETPEATGAVVASIGEREITEKVHAAPRRRRRWALFAALLVVAGAGVAFATHYRPPGTPSTLTPTRTPARTPAPTPALTPARTLALTPAPAPAPEPAETAEDLVRRADAQFAADHWSRALRLYRRAVRLDPSLRSRASIHENAILALRGKRSHREATRLLARELGAEAIPHLQRAVRETDDRRIRRRAKRLLKRLRRSHR